MVILLQVTKVECIRDEEFAESENQHDDKEEFTVDNFGFSVSPSDEQAVQFYLFNKISEIPSPVLDYFVRNENLYGSKDPWRIWMQFGGPNLEDGEDFYFFARLKKKSANGSRIDRRVSSGTWQGEDASEVVVSRKSREKIDSKKRFRYEKGESLHDERMVSQRQQEWRIQGKRESLMKTLVEEDIDQPVEPVGVCKKLNRSPSLN
ncbi:NAC transcription factor ONAC010-like [Citrus sinensis]|uniref:NAC transcription factor ONAC010-like n=1 Tax=Citrus sinensis TaxID=2711 RepID=UPI002277F2E5|nr:NAC transcription factor ONAC010-like [Citrus sinensis]